MRNYLRGDTCKNDVLGGGLVEALLYSLITNIWLRLHFDIIYAICHKELNTRVHQCHRSALNKRVLLSGKITWRL